MDCGLPQERSARCSSNKQNPASLLNVHRFCIIPHLQTASECESYKIEASGKKLTCTTLFD